MNFVKLIFYVTPVILIGWAGLLSLPPLYGYWRYARDCWGFDMETRKTYDMEDREISEQYRRELRRSTKHRFRDAEISVKQKMKYREPVVYRRHPLAKAVRKAILE